MRTCVRISVSVCDEKCGGGGVVVRVWSCVRVLHLAAMLLFYGAVLKYTRRRILVLVFTFYVLRCTFYVLRFTVRYSRPVYVRRSAACVCRRGSEVCFIGAPIGST